MDEKVEVVEANSFDETVRCLSGNEPIDLLLLDLLMPGMNGISGAKHICDEWPDVPVVVISVKEDIRSIRSVLRSGVMGYIPKSSSPKVTISAIQLVLSGGIYVPPHVLQHDVVNTSDTIDAYVEHDPRDDARQAARVLGVTPRQKDVLDLLALGKSNKEIASQLGLSPGTIKMHTSRLFKVLNVSSRTKAIAKYAQMKIDLKSD
jgi:DNA-binding NarL/FixJ family response regulator